MSISEAAAAAASPEGGKRLTHRRVLKIAVPIVLSNATVPILGAVDTGVVGQLGTAAPIGAVGIGAIVLTALYWVFGFLRMGTTGLTANAAGAGDRAEVAALLTRALMLGLAAGFLILALQGGLFRLAFLISPASAEVEDLARQYMGIRVWSAPAAVAAYGITGWLIAQERTGAVLVLQLVMNAVNISLDVIFVLVLDWGVPGVAAATFIAEWVGFGLGLWLCRAAFRVPSWRDWERVFDRAGLIRMALVNRDILLRSLALQVIFLSFMFTGARFGDIQLAANQVLLQFLEITAFALDGFAFAAEALVGQAMGRRDVTGLRRAVLLSSIWAAVICLGLAGLFALTGGGLIDLMTTSENVRAAARSYLPWMVAVPVLGIPAWMLDGVFIGATRAEDMRNMMLLSLAIYVACALVLVPMLGNHGLWAAFLISFVARGVTLGARYPALERSAGA
ncbi:MATE family efflux transporter [Pseudooceanicola algae]|uniref:DNA damage-inducible protein F n=1 Tax=Pseudooceanicola algae TaxID=1537215 RepID=A0A418SHI2_9RHOB|nr:MATE family efflux transporter [Pseudooceanicola algae]QPM90357.1 DNA damage-inducible protein F [Pseudooceanicola algae]